MACSRRPRIPRSDAPAAKLRRIAHAADATGKAIHEQLLAAALVHPGVGLTGVHAERNGGAEGKGTVLADVIVGSGMAALDGALLHGVQRLQAAHDGGLQLVGVGDVFAMGAKGLGHLFKAALLAHQPGLELAGPGGRAVGVDAQHGFLDGLPAAVVKHHAQDGQPVGLSHRVDRGGCGKVKAAIALKVHHARCRAGQLGAQGHAGALVQRLHETVDGEFQKYSATDGKFNREQFFNNRALERMFQNYGAVKFFLTRDHLREVIVKR